MKGRLKQITVALLLITTMLTVTSCWNRREMDELGIVMGTALDKDSEGKRIQLTAQVIIPKISAGNSLGKLAGSDKEGSKPFWNFTGTGETVFEAIREITHTSNRKLYFSHNKVIVIGEELAREGITEVLDFFIRDHELYPTEWILISRDKAREILEMEAPLGMVQGLSLTELAKAQTSNSQTISVDLQGFLKRLVSKTAAPVAACIKLDEINGSRQVVMEGTAVFRQNKLVGFLDKDETRGMLWVLGKVKSGIIVVNSVNEKGKDSMEIIRAESKIIPFVNENEISIKIKVGMDSSIGQETSLQELTDPSVIQELQAQQNRVIVGEINQAIKKAQEYNTDIFGFGEAVHRKYPRQWKVIEKDWDSYFPLITTTVEVDSIIKHPGLVKKYPQSDKEI